MIHTAYEIFYKAQIAINLSISGLHLDVDLGILGVNLNSQTGLFHIKQTSQATWKTVLTIFKRF